MVMAQQKQVISNWIVDFEKQQGVDATTEITTSIR